MAVLQRTRQRQSVRKPTTASGGGGGKGLGSWRDFGKGDGGYEREHEKLKQGGGPFTGLLEKFEQHVGASPFKPGIITSEQAGKAEVFAKDQVPVFVDNAKTFYKSAAKASDGDLKIKTSWANDFAIPHSNNLFEQQKVDHQVARHQMNVIVAQAGEQWHTTEEMFKAQGALEQLSKQTAAL